MRIDSGAWAMGITQFMDLKERLSSLNGQDIKILAQAANGKTADKPAFFVEDGVAIVPILGVMMPSVPWYYAYVGIQATSTNNVISAVEEASKNQDVKGILLYINSPGGRVDGTEQLADTVFRVRGKKKIVAAVNNTACSAAYWVASQAEAITANPGATIGSIGCIIGYEDWSEAYKAAGINVRLFASGPAKGAGYHMGAPLGEAGEDEFQRMVDDHGAMFTKAVSRGRNQDASEWATGATWRAGQAKAMGLIDKMAYANNAMRIFKKSVNS